jgi:hypothetical protein
MSNQEADPVIDEIRAIRHNISARFGHDPKKLVEYYEKLQEQHRDRLIDTSKERSKPDQSAA